MYIIGINAFHGDSSACILKDGRLIAAAEEERFRRIKHWAGFPSEAIKWYLSSRDWFRKCGTHCIKPRCKKPTKKIIFTFKNRPNFQMLLDRFKISRSVLILMTKFQKYLQIQNLMVLFIQSNTMLHTYHLPFIHLILMRQ